MSAEDPVADFLAREQDDMAGLEGDMELPAVVAEPIVDDFDVVPSTTEEVITNGHASEENVVENGLPETITAAAPPPVVDLQAMRMNDSSPAPLTREEPDTIRRWREAQEKRLKVKDENELKTMNEWRAQASKELAEWKSQHDDLLSKAKAANRKQEKDFIAERDAPMDGKPWEKITRLCELNAKTAKNTKDVSRLKGLLVQMRDSEK